MALYRVIYVREGRVRGITISASSPDAANVVAARLCAAWADGGEALTVAPFRPRANGRGGQGLPHLKPTQLELAYELAPCASAAGAA